MNFRAVPYHSQHNPTILVKDFHRAPLVAQRITAEVLQEKTISTDKPEGYWRVTPSDWKIIQQNKIGQPTKYP